jgi:hypothetical protein
MGIETTTKPLKPITVMIDPPDDYPLNLSEIKYTFETILAIAGFPWRFIRADLHASCDIYLGHRHAQVKRGGLKIMMNAGRKLTRPVAARKETVQPDKSIVLLFFDDEKTWPCAAANGDRVALLNNDIIFSSFILLSGWEERFIGKDRKDRHKIREAFLFQQKLLHTPIINQYGLLLRHLFSPTHSFLPSWPQAKKYAVALSHDVDYPELIPSIEAVRYIMANRSRARLSQIQNILTGRESFFKFDEWLTLEEKYGVKSAFYFCGFAGSLARYLLTAPDPFYDVRKKIYKDVMARLDGAGFEVGLHASYYAYRSERQFRAEKENVEYGLGKAISGNRHHCWHMNPDNPSETAHLHKDIGLMYDSSMAFEQASGFRRSICSPFHLYDRDRQESAHILQLPPVLMDDHLFGHSPNHNFSSHRDHILSLIQAVKTHGGVLTVDYHVRVLNSTFFPGWGKSYEFLLETITADKDYYCDTPVNIIRHCMSREKRLQDSSISEI